jgi:hypothetical protein
MDEHPPHRVLEKARQDAASVLGEHACPPRMLGRSEPPIDDGRPLAPDLEPDEPELRIGGESLEHEAAAPRTELELDWTLTRAHQRAWVDGTLGRQARGVGVGTDTVDLRWHGHVIFGFRADVRPHSGPSSTRRVPPEATASIQPRVNGQARIRAFARQHGLRAAVVLVLASFALRRILDVTGGVPAVPLDDTFIHFQYARSFWEGRGFAYTEGAEPVSGATSLLWPLLLTLPYGLGFRAESLIWVAWAFGWVALGMLAYEARRVSARLLSDDGALAAEAMVLCFGGHVWFAASGMEVVPLAWVLLRTARRAAEWLETPAAERRTPRELWVLAFAAPLLRPEGAMASAAVLATLVIGSAGRLRWLGALAALAPLGPWLVNRVMTGSGTSTTALVKWLPFSPYYADPGKLVRAVLENVKLLFGTLLNGEVWSAVYLPEGAAVVFWPALPALVWLGFRRNARARALLVAWVALGMLLPTTYDSFLWNRLRYLWPFAAAWFVGVAALADVIGLVVARYATGFERVRLLASGTVVGGLLSHFNWTLDDLATSANAIRAQQATLGHWAAAALPKEAVIGVNDTGAIGYFSERRVFDVVGLTTRGEARYWAAGAGSRFEHYERLPRAARPTHFIVYPEWFAIPGLLGAHRTERRVPGATILGGETMVAYDADYSLLGTGARPLEQRRPDALLLDELDVADLESEAAHGYALFDAVSAENVVVSAGVAGGAELALDGGRRNRVRESFEIRLAPGATFVVRVALDGDARFTLRATGLAETFELAARREWDEWELELPASVPDARVRVELAARDARFTALHYWTYRGAAQSGP